MKKIRVKRGTVPSWARYVAKNKSGFVCVYLHRPYRDAIKWHNEGIYTSNYSIKSEDLGVRWDKSLRKIEIIEEVSDKDTVKEDHFDILL